MAESTPAFVGSCTCEKVKYESREAPYGTTYCYCTTCRSLHGAPYAAFTNAGREGFEWTEREGLVWIDTSPIASRALCQFCNAPIAMIYHAWPREVSAAVASIDGRLSKVGVPEVQEHIFVAEKSPWYTIAEGGRQVPHFPDYIAP